MGAGHPRSSQVLHGVLNVRAFDDLTVLVTRRSISFQCAVPVLCCVCSGSMPGSHTRLAAVACRRGWCCASRGAAWPRPDGRRG